MLFTLVYHTYFVSKNRNLVFRNIFSHSKEQVSWSTLSMQSVKLQCCLQTTDRKGLSFSDFLDKCFLLDSRKLFEDEATRLNAEMSFKLIISYKPGFS